MGKRVGVLVAAAAVTAAIVGTGAQAAYPGRNGQIGFLGGRGAGSGETFHGVWLISPSGGRPHHVAGIPNAVDNFSISPSGKQIVFVAQNAKQIEIDTIATGKVRAVSSVPPNAVVPVWSPDGTQIAYDASGAITVIGVNGRDGHVICHHCGGTLAWSARGEIAYTGPGRSIWAVPAGGGTPRRITIAPRGRTDNQEDWSPDGSTLVFVRGNEVATHLFTVHADGTGLQEFTSIPPNPGTPAYSPDGTEIVFEPVNLGTLWLMGADGSRPHGLKIPGFSPTDPDWQPRHG
jgi:Tol biopolymer transport system component